MLLESLIFTETHKINLWASILSNIESWDAHQAMTE